jgi:hypothetical protein
MESMDIAQARHCEPTIKVDNLGAIPHYGLDVGVRPNDQKLAILDCDGLGPWLSLVDRVDFAVGVNRIGSIIYSGLTRFCRRLICW